MMLIRRLLPLLVLATWLTAQEDRLDGREERMERRIRERAERMEQESGKVDPAERERGEKDEEAAVDLSHLTPEERLARSVRHNASAFCRFVATVKPEKLMPGQTGTVVVSALLSGQAVLPSPPPMTLRSARQQGFVSLGDIAFRPAEIGRHAAAYVGRPVYDNFAIFEIPVSVRADAAIGQKQPVNVDLQFDIYDGGSAQPIGRFLDHFLVEVEVGRAADPAVVSLAGGSAPEPLAAAAAPTAGGGDTTAEPATPAATGRVIGGQDVVATPTADEPADVPPSPSEPEPDWSHLSEDTGALPWPVWFGGGFLLVGLIVLLARKK